MLTARMRGDDWVRHEVATALRLREAAAAGQRPPLRVIPVLVGGATPPAESVLPDDLKALPRIGMLKFDEHALKASLNTLLEALHGEDFEGQVRRLQEERRRLEEERRLLELTRKRRSLMRMASVGTAFALFIAAEADLFDRFGLDTRIATATMLLASLVTPRQAWSGEVVLVGIDEASERAVGRKFDPSWRAEHARVIGNAAAASARKIGFDIVLEDPADEAANAALERSLKATRDRMPVTFGVQSLGDEGGGKMLAPFASLARQGINCAGVALDRANTLPLAIRRPRTSVSAATGTSASAAASANTGDEPAQRSEFMASFALAAYSGGGRVELIDKHDQTVTVRLRPQRKTEEIGYYRAKTIGSQSGCDVLQRGDLVFHQLLDPYDLPPMRAAPQRIAYERVLAGDPEALASLKDRIVVVGVLLTGRDRMQLPWPAGERWGAELFAAQVDAMTRRDAIKPIHPLAEWALMSAFALLGGLVGHRLRERPRALRIAVLVGIALVGIALSVAWYRFGRELVGVPYDIAALALGAWLANRTSRRTPA